MNIILNDWSVLRIWSKSQKVIKNPFFRLFFS